ncbi:hypothetical protein P3L10_001218 [Capsicum annuum]
MVYACRGSFRAKTFQASYPQHHSTFNSNSKHGNICNKNRNNKDKEQQPDPSLVVKDHSSSNTKNMNHHSSANQSCYVMGHKTPNIRDLYTLGRKLGQGQFGTTYLCTDFSTSINYAYKCIAKRKLISKEDIKDVRREIQIMHHLAGHKNIVSIKGAYEDPLYVYIVMELCGGGELFDRII